MDQWFDGPMNVRIVHLGLHDVQCIHWRVFAVAQKWRPLFCFVVSVFS